jgi:hypothetical protein
MLIGVNAIDMPQLVPDYAQGVPEALTGFFAASIWVSSDASAAALSTDPHTQPSTSASVTPHMA